MSELVPGGNMPLPDTELWFRVPGPFDLSVLITGDSGKVAGDGDFVFYNQPSAPGARLRADGFGVDPRRLRAGASRVTVVVSPAEPGTPLGRLPVPALTVTGAGSRVLARFTPARPTHETVLLLVEIYRRGATWKLRALGQGYADGLAGIARDFGVEVAEEATGPVPPSSRPARAPAVPASAVAVPAVPASGMEAEFAGLVRAARLGAGVAPVTLDGRLSAAARAHAAVMAGQRRLSAEGPDGLSVFQRITAGGYRYLRIDQQLVSGPRTAAEFLDYCLTDGATRRPLHDPALTDAGIAQHHDSRSGDVYWTALWAAPFTAAGLLRTAAEVLSLTNAERTRAGLRPLADDRQLAKAAQGYSADMAARAFYSHTSPEGLAPWDRAAAAGAGHRGIGENIACGQRDPREVVRGWMDSPGHRANILKPDFTHLGVGFAGGGPAGTYWTQLFGQT
ncbi:CAP domain-containing protein [Streptomyces scopuliridis]|uniref:CAP domain-containing protein n=1 Tax=Streptomyces scopuliridis TaxID=452529 RepID=A0ACD4ZWA4_9ACTN|nr:CAP domain-containing protein [Streptomyces scopuliridis]WSC02568.1 CAP domain-containing protein [Streptomyces scopuliridis]WSC03900.1 CAP domain-containing protein [Streptomyces scopuliridis]